MVKKHRVKSLYYITHIDNIPSMLERGILSHQSVDEQAIEVTRIYDSQIVLNRLAGIERGLIWLGANYRALGLVSLAIPALGCGLGKLAWRDVGPLMSKHLSHMDIPTAIYLPREQDVPPAFLSKSFLLKDIKIR